MDSLRYWVLEMHVDGFRLDLASALARELFDVNNLSAFFDVIQQDPVISQVKLIAEPWDVGPGGYQVGNFPVLWTEWNGKYRDTMRQFVKGDANQLGQMASRITGSSDLYEHSGRKPHASINFVTCHDGFTLTDLVSYNEKHNQANGEESRDGESHNNSWNCSVEGPSNDPAVVQLRYQQKRNLMALLFLSLGVPMLSGGDELGRTQGGNNNAYCQDNEISWYQWDLNNDDEQFFRFIQKLIQIRKEQLVIHRKTFFKPTVQRDGTVLKDISWLNNNGKQMSESDWIDPERRVVGALLDGSSLQETDPLGRTVNGRTVLMLANSHYQDVPFLLPKQAGGKDWRLLLDTSETISQETWPMQKKFGLKGRSIVLLELVPEDKAEPTKLTATAKSV
jgi:glycogen operon protein